MKPERSEDDDDRTDAELLEQVSKRDLDHGADSPGR